ncbi:MAG: glycoside hydrolase family 2 [Bacteroidales bacterium]|nr:glycoside hydrolase family 2 [Bacteroidales bacterium]
MTFVRLSTFLTISLIFACCTRPVKISQDTYNNIQEGFITPADTNKPWCYYYWVGDEISEEGITRDLEAMKEFGLGAVLIASINPDEVDGPVPIFSEAWWNAIVHVVNEGHRIGIDVGFFNCPGWSQSGGPWVTYDKTMRHLVYSETNVKGGGEISLKLVRPKEEFQDTYVLAFKKIVSENHFISKKNTLFPLGKKDQYVVDLSALSPLVARSILLTPADPIFKCNVELQAKVDGTYKTIKSFVFDRSNSGVSVGPVTHGPVAISIPETKAEAFRVVCTNPVSSQPRAGFAEIRITESRVLENFIEKSLGKMHPTPYPEFKSYMWDAQDEIDDNSLLVSEVLDLSENMDQNGALTWDAPQGEWTILRMGMTPTGAKNTPTGPQGKGYEIDKANSELSRFHFEHYMAELIKRIPEESRSVLKYMIIDSYEMGSQNWTDGFAEKFKKKFGYDPVKYLPVFSGRVVGSVEESDRFLWDIRRSVADNVAYEYVGGLRKAANEYGLKTWLENYGHWGYPGEFLMYGGQSDLVAGEFWTEGTLGDIECKSGSAAAHTYGKPITYAEAFTAGQKAYTRYPAMLKKRGDWCWTEGINHFVLHLYIQQPREEAPGVNAWFSTEFNRLNTWFDQGSAWVDYVRRCQHMLQQGRYAADIIYFIGEDAPKMTGTKDPELPLGYSYDYINAEVIMERLSIKNGRFVLPDGMTYSILVLPENANMRPAVLAKMEELVQTGGTILGGKPMKSPSLQNYPMCDQEILDIANRMWGTIHAGEKLEKEHGEGYVLDGMDLKEALDFLHVQADVLFPAGTTFLWIHRTMPGMEIYFLTNQGEDVLSFEPSFNVTGLQPQLWDAVTGEIRKLNDYTDDGSRTVVPLSMEKYESCFIVFNSVSNENTSAGYIENSPRPENFTTLEKEWTIDFKNKEFGPADPLKVNELTSWTESADWKVKYYSGTAAYTTEFTLEEVPDGDLFINLGKVGVMASVTLNGADLGVTWMAPYRISAKNHLVSGTNQLKVEVVNIWRNRMVGDMELPEADRFTSYTYADLKEGEELTPSGLMGPVSIEVIRK